MAVFVSDFDHAPGQHCASTALSNILRFHGLPISEAMVFGLGAGLGFFYIRNDDLSPKRLYHGRTVTLESDFCTHAALSVVTGVESDDRRAWQYLREQLAAGIPVMLSTDTFYLAYQNTTSHFPGHRAVAVGFDEAADRVYLADRKLLDYQAVSRDELRLSRNADDYPMPCRNEFHHFHAGSVTMGRSLPEAIQMALRRNAAWMLGTSADELPFASMGLEGMRKLAADLPDWKALPDWSWAARFAYQIIVKRGSGGLFFRSIYRDFLSEAAELIPPLGGEGLVERTASIANAWGEVAAVLKEESEKENCVPALFEEAGAMVGKLAEREEELFREIARVAEDSALWAS